MKDWKFILVTWVALSGTGWAQDGGEAVSLTLGRSAEGPVICLSTRDGAKISATFGVRVYRANSSIEAVPVVEIRNGATDYLPNPIRIDVPDGDDKAFDVEFGVCINGTTCIPQSRQLSIPQTSRPSTPEPCG